MIVKCQCESCVHWSKNGGDFVNEGGCTLDTITISDDNVTAAGFIPMCEEYREKND